MEEFEGTDDLKNLFKEILGSDVDIKDNLEITDDKHVEQSMPKWFPKSVVDAERQRHTPWMPAV